MPRVVFVDTEQFASQQDVHELHSDDMVLRFRDFPPGDVHLLAMTLRGVGCGRDDEMRLFDHISVTISTPGWVGDSIPGIGFVDDKIFKLVRQVIVKDGLVEVALRVDTPQRAHLRVILWGFVEHKRTGRDAPYE